ncbi:MAG: DUF4159 domain-containing protein [Rhodovarius sp.]|nr:DUF4159 domain-containing protein [Rhodovarius sp.]MDW8313465.1 DUF4159 domain-containing protein [Rhodovarius sp.]
MITFAAPWLLVGLLALPVLYWLLRITPPEPRPQSFPPVALLRDLPVTEETPARTPWWVLLLRLLAAALVILGLARPTLGPQGGVEGEGPLLVVVDDGWASGADWGARMAAAEAALEAAARQDRPVALLATAPGEGGNPPRVIGPMPAPDLRARLSALRPKPWPTDPEGAARALADWRAAHPGPFAALHVSDGLPAPALAAALRGASALTLLRAEDRPRRILAEARAEPDRLRVLLRQTPQPAAGEVAVLARTADGRALGRILLPLPAGATEAAGALTLPIELRNQIVRLEIENEAQAAAVLLLDERFRRRPVGLLPGAEEGADAPLIGELFYISRALEPYVELRRGSVETLLSRPLSVLVLADRPVAPGREEQALAAWVEQGGMLIRFAGSRLAERPDGLLPVRLRAERALGGGLTWEQPQPLAPFPEHSPFAGLPTPAEVLIERQVLAEPSPRLSERIWARLADGTPLVTAEARGRGRIVLFHVTATADWSSLPLSGLFVQMLRRLVALSAGVAGGPEGEGPLAPLESLDGFGRATPPFPAAAALPPGEGLPAPSPRHPPGWYGPPGADAAFRRALNLGPALPPPVLAEPPAGARLGRIETLPREADLGPWLLAAALILLAVDLLIALRLRGLLPLRLRLRPRPAAWGLALLLAAAPAAGQPLPEGAAANHTRLAYVITGDPALDELQRAGLIGLSDFVNRRTAVTLAEPVGVVPGESDLSFYPLLYWAVPPDAQPLSPAAIAALNDFMRHGGIILFDTRSEGSGEGFAPGARAALRRVTQGLAIPPLAPVPEDHVLRRAFYLLSELPGRFTGGQVWVARDTDRANDSVSPVVIGGHDWAGAWAVDARGQHLHAAVPGGARQRTLAYRFGTNLVIYALTGNYKGDQVHVPAILERLGQ